MTRPGCILLLLALTGCASHHAAKPAAAPSAPADWTRVLTIPRGTLVFVTADTDGVHEGFMWQASGTAVIVSEISGGRAGGHRSIARRDVARVTARLPVAKHPKRDSFIGIGIASAFVGGLTGMIVGGVQKDQKLKGASAVMFFSSLMAAEAACVLNTLGYPKGKVEDRVVYVRPR